MKRVLLAAAGVALLTAPSALSADLRMPVKAAPVAVAAFDWSGFYIGINGGGKWMRGDGDPGFVSVPATPPIPANATRVDFEGKSATFGGQMGWNWQFARQFMIGIEGDFNWTDLNSTFTLSGTPGVPFVGTFPGNAPDSFSWRMRWEASIRGRLAWLAGPGMLYLTGGLALADVTVNGNFPVFSIPGGPVFPASAGSSSKVLTGWTAGIGGEFAINQNWSLGTEYRYSNYGREAFGVGTVAVLPAPGGGFINAPATVDHDFSTHELLVKLNYRFSWAGPLSARF